LRSPAGRFIYADETGATLFAVGRFEYQNPDGSFVLKDGKNKKTFRQARRDPDNPTNWLHNVKGVRVVPYRLPELIESIGNGHTVLIVEGEGKVELLRSWNVPATCNAGGGKNWKSEHSAFFLGADVVILPDNDEPGRDHANLVGASLQGIAASVRVLELQGLPPKGDIVDWAAAGGTVEQLHELIERHAKPWVPPKSTALVAFPLIAFKDLHLDASRRNYLIKGLLPRTGLAVIWGPPKCYKSFLATDMAFHVALGWQYRGRRVQQTPVVYIALEGREGQAARKEGFAKFHDVDDAPFYLMTKPLDLIKQAGALLTDIEAQLKDITPGIVFIDTLNRSLVGSESKDEDMGRYLAAAAAIEDKFKCLVAIVHHCGIDRDRPRGHTSLSAAVEAQIRVDRTADLQATLTVELAKDFPEGTELFCHLDAVEVGIDPDGDPIRSLVVLPHDPATAQPSKRLSVKGLGSEQKNALAMLSECLAEVGRPPPSDSNVPAGVTVTLDQWREQLFRRGVLERGDGKNPATKWSRLKSKLFERGYIGIMNELVWRL
jgi:AAA domain